MVDRNVSRGNPARFGRRVALHTHESLSSEIREKIEDKMALLYRQA